MKMQKPITYRDATWEIVSRHLDEMSDEAIFELGLTQKPEIISGTVFMADEIHEYIIDRAAAEQLASSADEVAIHYIGGDPARTFTRDELLEALRQTTEFDQVSL